MTMRQVAKHAGVSVATVSRVFNSDPKVAAETRDRVLASMSAVNFRPSALSKSFRTGRTGTVGVVLPDVTDPFFASLLAGVDDRARQRGIVAVATSVANQAEVDMTVVRTLVEHHVDGLIYAPTAMEQRWLEPLIDPGAVVFVDRRPNGIVAPAIVNDDAAAVDLALEALRRRGCARVVLAGGVSGLPTTALRRERFAAAAPALGLSWDSSLIADSGTAAQMVRERAVDGVLACSPHAAVAVLCALRGTPVTLASIGDFPLSELIVPEPIVVDQDPYRIGQAAVDDLLDGVALDHVRTIPVRIRDGQERSRVGFTE